MESQQASNLATLHSNPSSGIEFKRLFTHEGLPPFKQVKWDKRAVSILDASGKIIFEQEHVETPEFWSQTAINVVSSKYFRENRDTGEKENSVRTLISRVVDTITEWGDKDCYFKTEESKDIFRDELTYLLLNQHASFNSPVWFNVGVEEHPQCSACFILSVDDSMDSLLELQQNEARLFKFGSGAGSNLSSIRSSKEKLKGGGIASGPVSFMRGYDAWAGVIKSGGKTRRAAKMQILNVEHPDILDFIDAKSSEEKKAWALIEQGYDGGFATAGGAYDSVAFQNANLSVRVTDEFMQAAENGSSFQTKKVRTGEPCEKLNARSVLQKIAEATYICGDPGLQFDTEINDWHTCPESGRINASNPCSEYMHLDNSACNLASLNLLKFFSEDGEFLLEEYLHAIEILITAQDILIDNSRYPTEAIAECARNFRQLGLGFANLGATLMSLGVPYDSDEGREWAAILMSLLTGQAYKTSAELAAAETPFAGYDLNSRAMLSVIDKHRKAANSLQSSVVPDSLKEKSDAIWKEAYELGQEAGFRNSQVSVLAPTGTISFMMDCDTTGIEPDLALVKYKKLVGGGLIKLVNNSVSRALRTLGYSEEDSEKVIEYIEEHDTIEGSDVISPEHLPIFDCAFVPAKGERSIGYLGHLKMMGAVQPFVSGAISKTVNLPKETTIDEIYEVYLKAWKLGLKAVALYRDGSKRTQPLNTEVDSEVVQVFKPIRRHLPDERNSVTHKLSIAGLEGYVTVGMFEDGSPGEIFIVVAKEGSTLSGIMDAFATSISMALQYGVPLGALVKKFTHMRFEPSGFTPNKDIPMAKSIVDYIFQWMAFRFLDADECQSLGLVKRSENGKPANTKKQLEIPGTEEELIMSTFQNMEDAPFCTSCGSGMMVRQAGCYTCLNCGSQGGCG